LFNLEKENIIFSKNRNQDQIDIFRDPQVGTQNKNLRAQTGIVGAHGEKIGARLYFNLHGSIQSPDLRTNIFPSRGFESQQIFKKWCFTLIAVGGKTPFLFFSFASNNGIAKSD
jgi:hypothetical protein